MKPTYFALILLLIICPIANLYAQAPNAIPYQAVARNASGNLILNQLISLRFTLHDSSGNGAIVYQETQSTTTNALGLFSLNIGLGISLDGNFTTINWKNNSKFLQVELDASGGTNYANMGTTQMLSVPYALYAKSNGDVATNGLEKINDSISLGGRMRKETTIALDGNEMVIRDINTNTTFNTASQTLFPSFVNIGAVTLTQTFLVSNTAKLANIRIYVNGLNGTSITLNVKNSAGTSLGNISNTYNGGSAQWSIFTFSNSPLLYAGEIYTISVTGTAGTVWYYSAANPYTSGVASLGSGSDFAFEVNQYGENGLLYLGNNAVGIGTDTPDGKLDVNGKTKTTQLQVTNNAGANKVLVSDASGNGNWTATSTIASGSLDQAYNFGGSVVGRDINASSGALKITGTDGILVTGIYGNGDISEINGSGTRMFFNPFKAAFRAGQVFGNNWNNDSIGPNSTAFGYSTKAKGNYSTAMGYYSEANGNSSTAIGNRAITNGSSSIAMGNSTQANGISSIAMGSSSSANGGYSTALGKITEANGDYSTAMGYFSKANGNYSTSMGYTTSANGAFSTTKGHSIQANGYSSLCIGLYNDTIVPIQTGVQNTTPIFIIGNGSFVSNSNAFIVRYDGKVGIGINTPTHLLHVAGIARSTQSAWATSSDQRVKKNIQSLENNSMQKIMQLRPVTYEWIDEYAKASKGLKKYNTGFISQELEQVFPEMIEQVEEKFGDKTINDFRLLNLSDLPVHLVKAMQEHQKELDDLKKEIQTLKELIKHK